MGPLVASSWTTQPDFFCALSGITSPESPVLLLTQPGLLPCSGLQKVQNLPSHKQGQTGRSGCVTHLGLVILEPMGFVYDEAGPADGAEGGLVDGDQFVRGQQNVELDLGLPLPT